VVEVDGSNVGIGCGMGSHRSACRDRQTSKRYEEHVQIRGRAFKDA
jgi:hypothetical protein